MKSRLISRSPVIVVSLVPLLLIGSLSSGLSQGSLTPPGAPAPTMKALDQIEPRTPISALPFTITTGGHYYLTRSLSATGDGITIQADDVVLDLNGFTLTGDAGSADAGVQTSGTRARIIIRNGTLRNFGTGLFISNNASQTLLEDLVLNGNSGAGLVALSNSGGGVSSSIFRRLRASENGGPGLSFSNAAFVGSGQNLIDQCVAVNNSTIGFSISTAGNLIIRCAASGNATNYNIAPNNRFGIIVTPPQNPSLVSGNSGGAGSGTTDPFANLTY